MTLTNEVQQILDHLKANPQTPPFRSRDLPMSLARAVQRHFVQVIRNHPEIGDYAIELFAWPYRSPHKLQEFYAVLLDIGVEEDDVIKRLLFWFLETRILKVSGSMLAPSDEVIAKLASKNRHAYARFGDYELGYAMENHLCFYGDGRWQLTGLGRTLLRLSVLQATRFLLTLELFLHANEWDEWHMSRDFLEHVSRGQNGLSLAKYGSQSDSESPHVWREYTGRLIEFGLVGGLQHQSNVLTVTSLGKLTIDSVLAHDSAFDNLIPLYVHEEIVGAESPDFTSEEDVERIRGLLRKSELVKDLLKPIVDEVERLRQANAAYFSIFKALAPCIEGILRNLLDIEHMAPISLNLGGCIKALEGVKPPVLKPGTLQMIDAVFRPYRNIVEHGHVIAPEPARMLCEISLAVIEQIHKDYAEFKDNRP